jgi:hypothetical protein
MKREKRMGRKLQKDDLMDAPLNNENPYTSRLLD